MDLDAMFSLVLPGLNQKACTNPLENNVRYLRASTLPNLFNLNVTNSTLIPINGTPALMVVEATNNIDTGCKNRLVRLKRKRHNVYR